MDNPSVKGAVAEQAIVLAAMKLGVPVLRPVAEHGRTDLALDIAGRLWRVQCKWGRVSLNWDVIVIQLSSSSCRPTGYLVTTYTEREVDLFGVYCGELADASFSQCREWLGSLSSTFVLIRRVISSEHVLPLQMTSISKGL